VTLVAAISSCTRLSADAGGSVLVIVELNLVEQRYQSGSRDGERCRSSEVEDEHDR
jgi:hypothetical protein